jgi:heme A synthase
MMGRALLVVGALATIAFIATGVLGYLVVDSSTVDRHVVLGLAAGFLLLFSHSWIMFYLIGTGKMIKEAVAEHELPEEWIEKTKEFKNRSYPWLMLAMGLAMITFILGGGVETQVLPKWIHWGLFYLAVAAQFKALYLELLVLTENERLIGLANRTVRQREATES